MMTGVVLKNVRCFYADEGAEVSVLSKIECGLLVLTCISMI